MMMLNSCRYRWLISKIYLVNLDWPATWLAYPSNLLAVSMQTCACTYAVSTGYVSAYGEVSQPVLVLVLIRTCTRVPLVWVVLVVVLVVQLYISDGTPLEWMPANRPVRSLGFCISVFCILHSYVLVKLMICTSLLVLVSGAAVMLSLVFVVTRPAKARSSISFSLTFGSCSHWSTL